MTRTRSNWLLLPFVGFVWSRLTPARDQPLRLTPRWKSVGRGGAYKSSNGFSDDYYADDGWNGDAYVADGYDYEPPRRRAPSADMSSAAFPMPDRKTGLIMVTVGAAFTMLGISLFFEKNLIRLGNILLVAGAPIVVGPRRASRYLLDPTKLRGSIVFGLGFLLILSGHPLLGIVVEVFGFLNLFGNLFPLFGVMISRLPFMAGLSSFSQGIGGGRGGVGGGDLGPDVYGQGGQNDMYY